MSLLDLVAPQHVDDFKQLLKRLSQGRGAAAALRTRSARHRRQRASPPTMEFTPGAATKASPACRSCSAARSPIRSWRAKSRNCASATRSPACSIARRSCARSRTRVADAAQNDGAARPAADRARPLRAAAAGHRPRRRRRAARPRSPNACATRARRRCESPRASPSTASRVLLRNSDHVATAQLAETHARGVRRRTCSRSAQSLSVITVSIGGVQIGEKIASVSQVLAKASQGVQSSVGVGGNRAEIFDPERGRPRRRRAHRSLGRAHRAKRWTTTASSCITSR